MMSMVYLNQLGAARRVDGRRTDDDGCSLGDFSNLFILLHDLLDPGLGA